MFGHIWEKVRKAPRFSEVLNIMENDYKCSRCYAEITVAMDVREQALPRAGCFFPELSEALSVDTSS